MQTSQEGLYKLWVISNFVATLFRHAAQITIYCHSSCSKLWTSLFLRCSQMLSCLAR